jgi:hypothetical protein
VRPRAPLTALALMLFAGACGGAETRGGDAVDAPPACSDASGVLPADVGQTPPPEPAAAGDVPPMRCGDGG